MSYPMLKSKTTGNPMIVLVDALCPACGAVASGSIRHGSIHVPCGECMNDCANMDIPFGDAIPVPFRTAEGKGDHTGVVSRKECHKRFPGSKLPRRAPLIRDWERIVAHEEAK